MEEIAKTKVLQFKKRGNGKYRADCLSDDIYYYYCEKYGNKFDLTKKQFLDLLKELNDSKFELILNKAWTFKLPSRLGLFRVRKRKTIFKLDKDGNLDTKYLNIDYKATKDLWAEDDEARKKKELIFHFNEHTDGYKFPWFWDKRISNAKNQSYYKVIITRTHNRNKNKVLKSNNKIDYFE